MWPKSGFLGSWPDRLQRLYQELCPAVLRSHAFRWQIVNKLAAPMTLSVTHATEDASPTRGLLPLWVGAGIYALFMLAGNRLLIDPDTMWQITVGQWILDHRAVPETDVFSFTMRGQPWISTQWLAQVLYAKTYAVAGWSGAVVLAATAITPTFALFTKFLSRRLSESTTLVFVAAALALTVPHLLARPHVLAMPFMVAWAGGLLAAALIAAGRPPYGGNWLLAWQKILALGSALPLIMEWKPADFGSVGALELCLLLGIGLALWRGIKLPPLRIVLLLGLLHMSLAQGRAGEILALLAPLVLAAPLARQIGGADVSNAAPPARGVLYACAALLLVAGTFAYA